MSEPEQSEESFPKSADEAVRVYVKPANKTGLYQTTVRCGELEFSRDKHLENEEERQQFIEEALPTATGPLDSPEEARKVIAKRLEEALRKVRGFADQPLLQPMSKIVDFNIRWLWPSRIARGKLTMLVGNPSVGKSLVALDMAARVSTGQPWPEQPSDTPQREPADVLLLTETDDPCDTICPRLLAQGADLDRIHLLNRAQLRDFRYHAVHDFSQSGTFDMLRHALHQLPNCQLILVDALSDYLAGEEPLALSGWAKIAREFDLALLVLDYPKPAPGRPNKMRSQTITHSAARTVWAIVRNGQQHSQRLLLPLKNSLARYGNALAFRITTCDKYDTARIDWQPNPLAVSGVAVDVAPSLQLKSNRTTKRELACVWLEKQLHEGPRLSQEILAAARVDQITEKPLRQALHQLGGTTRKGPGGRWFWSLPVKQLEHVDTSNRKVWQTREESSQNNGHPVD